MHPFHPFLHDGGPSLGWRIAAVVLWVLLLAGLGALGVLLARRLTARPPAPMTFAPAGGPFGPPRSPALDELDLRYARGDIGRDDYLGRRADLISTAGMPWHPGPAPYAAPAPPPPAPPATTPPSEPPNPST